MMNMNDLLGKAKDMADSVNNDADSTDSSSQGNNLDSLIAMAKDIDMDELKRYKNMSKTELFAELKNSEHSETVITLIKDLIAKKGE